MKKPEDGERTFFKKKGDSKHDLVKNVVFEKKGEYVKGERKGRKSIIKSKRIFKKKKKKRYIQKVQQKKRNMGKNRFSRKRSKKENVQKKKRREDTQKRRKIEKTKKQKKDREKDEHAKTYKFVNMSNKKVKSFRKCRSVKYVFLIDRDNKKRKIRQQMNKSMNKRRT